MDFRLAPDDISAIRFGISPGHELSHAIRVLQRPDDQPLQWGWLRGVRDRVPREAFELSDGSCRPCAPIAVGRFALHGPRLRRR